MKRRTILWWGIGAIALMVNVALIFAYRSIYREFRIPTIGMSPTLNPGDRINAFRRRDVAPGDIAVFQTDDQSWRVMRVIAVAGDVVEIRDKRLFINGVEMAEVYVFHDDPQVYPNDPTFPEPYRARDQFGPYRVPPRSFFVLGDNRDHSRDSRYMGAIPMDQLFGVAVSVLSPTRGLRTLNPLPPTPK